MLEQILRIFWQQRTAAQIRVVAPPESPYWKKFDSAESWKEERQIFCCAHCERADGRAGGRS